MAVPAIRLIGVGVVLVALFYQWYLKDILFVSAGLGRVMQPIEDFPYNCRRIRHERLEGCEDLWLDDEARVLYAACTSSAARPQWNPTFGVMNISARRPGGDYISVLNIDKPGKDGLYGLHQLEHSGYEGTNGDRALNLHGFDVEILDNNRLRFRMINHRPPVNENGWLMHPGAVGANSTIEVFDVKRGSNAMAHVKTIVDTAVMTPNGLVSTGDGGFVFTNDKSAKVGLRRELDQILGGGSVGYCGPSSCHIAASTGFNFPNGLTKGKDGLYYVPSSFKGTVRVMEMHSDHTLTEVTTIHLGMPIDNLSTDKNGDIYAAAFPKPLQLLDSIKDPYHIDTPSTIWRIRKSGSGYEVKKLLEDKEAKIMGGATTASHDVKTGKLFMGGAFAPYITVCDPK